MDRGRRNLPSIHYIYPWESPCRYHRARLSFKTFTRAAISFSIFTIRPIPIFRQYERAGSLFYNLRLPIIAFPGFVPCRHRFGFIRCKGLLSRLIRQLEMYSLQILPCYARVIGRESRRMKLYRQLCTASIKPQSGSGRKRTEQREGKINH